MIRLGLALTGADDLRAASLPLFAAGEVDAIEWSFDVAWGHPQPAWADALLDHYGEAGALYGHGVTYSLLSAHRDRTDDSWLQQLARECQARRYGHVTEHHGFMRTEAFAEAPPLPVPLTESALRVGQERLCMLAERCGGVPVGVENLAFAFFAAEARGQGAFLAELVTAVDGFLLLDLHNLYCQMENFALSADVLLESYPLERVREIHISGGSWRESRITPGRQVRRDTHDGPVPDPVLALLAAVVPRCPALELVIVEQFPGSLADPAAAERFRADYRRARAVLEQGLPR